MRVANVFVLLQCLQALENAPSTLVSASVLPAYSYETALHSDLLRDYNIQIPPKSNADEAINVTVSLNVFKIAELNLGQSLLELHVWLRTSWVDPRLSWDPSAYGNVSQTSFNIRAGSLEDTQIWCPDIQLYNQAESLYDLAAAGAMVYNDGSVFFSRPGKLSVLCAFKGLDAFPFDQISCDFELGGWSRSGADVYYTLAENALSQGGSATAQATYAQYGLALEKSSVSISDFYYPCCPNVPWPIIKFRIYTTRASSFFVKTIIIPNIVLVLLSFAVFFFHVQCGERLGYGITLILAMVASDIIIGEKLPVCNEWLWAENFSGGSIMFAVAALIETCVVTHLYYRADDVSQLHSIKYIVSKLEKYTGIRVCNRRAQKARKGAIVSDIAKKNMVYTPERIGAPVTSADRLPRGSSDLRLVDDRMVKLEAPRPPSPKLNLDSSAQLTEEPMPAEHAYNTTNEFVSSFENWKSIFERKDADSKLTASVILIQTVARRFLAAKRIERLRIKKLEQRNRFLVERGQSETQVHLAQNLDKWSGKLFPIMYVIFLAYMGANAGVSGDARD